MSEQNFGERVERVVRDLLAGRRPKVGPKDAPERDAIMAASRLAGLRDPYPRMSPAFRRRLQKQLREGRAAPLLSRRDALVAALAAAAGVAGTGALARVTGVFAPPAPAARSAARPVPQFASSTIQPVRGTWFDAGPLSALPEGEAVHFRAGSISTVLFREGGAVRGLSAICTHLPCELGWNPAARTLDCPCHPQAFDAAGKNVSVDYPLPPLPAVEVEVVDGRVRVLGA